jgi:hypothetical protein
MKKLYFLDEEEKNRILNLHESATKRQYLGEQEDSSFGGFPTADINPLSPKNLIPGLKREDNWKTTYSCVPSQGVKPSKLSDGSTAYLINGVTYYNNGRKKLANGTMTGYTCSTEFKDKSTPNSSSSQDKAKKAQQYKQQIVTKTSDTTKQIQALLGLDQTGVMDSGLLQKINDKLNGNSQPRPKVQSVQDLIPNVNIQTPNAEEQIKQIASQQQISTKTATTPPTNKEKRQQRRDLRAANKAEMQALRDKQRGNQ